MTAPLLTEIAYEPDSARLFEAIADRPWAAFLDSGAHHPGQSRYDILAAEPYLRVVTRGALTEVHGEHVQLSRDDPLRLLADALQPAAAHATHLPFSGGAIGYFSYDLGRRMHRLPEIARDAERVPDLAIGIYDWALVVDHHERRAWLVGQGRDPETDLKWDALVEAFSAPVGERARAPFRVLSPVTSNMTPDQYAAAYSRIERYIREGDCYQVNLAQRFRADATGDPWLAYQALRVINPAPFGAYLSTPYTHVLSASPERFLRVEHERVETKPIKGTRRRAGHARLDAELAEELRRSEKDRAENVMIVDLLRNDLSRTCRDVRVPRLFDIESFPTVHHLVSTVTGTLRPGRDVLDLLAGAFPGGSITGAPKRRAMEIIEELEPHRRGVYCGAIGYIGFDGDMDLNIAIRTLVYSRGEIRFWAGGGIVADSNVSDEYQETFDKGRAMLHLLQQCAGRAAHNGG